jgi:hypothetical protein
MLEKLFVRMWWKNVTFIFVFYEFVCSHYMCVYIYIYIYIYIYVLINFMVHSPSCEADICRAIQEIFHLL